MHHQFRIACCMNSGDMGSRILIVVFLVICGTWRVYSAVATCTAPGRFADTSDPTCQNYTYCVYNHTSGRYLAYYYHCPTTSVFNPNTQKCTASTNYACPGTMPPASSCTAAGFISDPSSVDCTTFLICVASGGSYISSTNTCPTGTLFDPTLGECVYGYVCPTSCTGEGRFPTAGDTTCTTFYSCIATPNGYIQTQYPCPSPSLFNPTTQLCSTTYTC